MITLQQTDQLLNIAVLGEFTLADFKQFEENALYKLKSPGEIDLLLDLRGMLNYTADVAWQEIKFFGQEHNHDFNRIAVVTSDQWITWQTWLSRLFVDADIRVFENYTDAQDWIGA